jgi:hypothetical protein
LGACDPTAMHAADEVQETPRSGEGDVNSCGVDATDQLRPFQTSAKVSELLDTAPTAMQNVDDRQDSASR